MADEDNAYPYPSKNDRWGIRYYLPGVIGFTREPELEEHEYPSLCVLDTNYDHDTNELTIEFVGPPNGGPGTYVYYDVPVSEWVAFNNANSRGTYFNLYIRDQYSYAKIG